LELVGPDGERVLDALGEFQGRQTRRSDGIAQKNCRHVRDSTYPTREAARAAST
jgi:hypothetical protein